MCRLKGNHETDFRITAIMDGLVLAAFLVVIIFGIVNIFLGQGCLLVRILESLLLFGVGAVLGCVYIWLLHPLKHIKREVYNIAETEEMENQELSEVRVRELTEDGGLIGSLIWTLMSKVHNSSKAKALNAEVALYALQSEINPHFLYNSLEVIRSFAMKHGVEDISEMALALARVFRYSISRPGEVATLADEINNVKNYVKIQQYRFPDRFDVVYDVDEKDQDIMQCKLPVLTLQPIFENALSHGLEPLTEKGRITLRASVSDRRLMISITDTGVGIAPEKLEDLRKTLHSGFVSIGEIPGRHLNRKAGVSLNNVSNRLRIYFGSEYGLNVTSCEGQFTTIEIIVPKVMAM